ncbi:MAG: diguanylate cyclase [Pseudomonadales bacterium]|nr:diguanylate cyclase [Pseudomonadales bacterium]
MNAVPAPFSNAEKMRILIVDDEVNILRSLRRLLLHTDYSLIFTSIGHEAINILNNQEIAVIICDQYLSDMNGDLIIQKLYKENRGTVRIMMSGSNNYDFLENAINGGKIEYFIRKPWDAANLLETLHSAVAQYQEKKQQIQIGHIIDHAKIGMFMIDGHFRVISVNPIFLELTGYRENNLIGQSIISFSGVPRSAWTNYLYMAGQWHHNSWLANVPGKKKKFSICAIPSPNMSGGPYYMCMLVDCICDGSVCLSPTNAGHDPLTGLPNRSLLDDRFTYLFAKKSRYKYEFSAIFLDLDLFKNINDSFGHTAGDYVLKTTAKRLQDTLRSIDTVCRYGGDEFVILLPECSLASILLSVSKKILNAISQPIQLENQNTAVCVGGSIGGAVTNLTLTSQNKLIDLIDRKMYEAKKTEGNTIVI